MIAASNDTLRDAYGPQRNVEAEELLDRAEQRIFAIAERKVAGQLEAGKEIALRTYDAITESHGKGLETGWFDINDMLQGLRNSDMIVVAARPSMGKSAFMSGIVESICIDQGLPTALFSLEMSKQQLMQ